MWSKQADTRNKNATSFKSKITNRKQKTSETKTSATQLSDSTVTSPNPANSREGKSGKKQKNRKNRKDGSQAKQVSTEPDLIDGLQKISADNTKTNTTIIRGDEVTKSTNANVELSVESDDRLADVVLRNDGKANGSVDCVDGADSYNLKRYSDSFVIGTDDSESVRNICQSKLSRAVSGFILTEPDNAEYNIKEEKVGRKTRRFSDLFSYGALKTYNSCDNLKISPKMIKNFEVDETGALDNDLRDVILRKVQQKTSSDTPKKVKGGKTNENVDNKNVDVKNTKCKVENMPMTNTNNSYLKRVKSKIYKSKNDNNVGSSLPSMPDISETVKSKKNKNKKNAEIKSKAPVVLDGSEAIPEVKKSITHFDFRLIRQTSNLERIRPRTFGPKKSSSNNGISDITDTTNAANSISSEKPVLAKSKSSSAINLNMLRTRRNKIMEQVKNRNCKVVQNEFDFIAFSNRLNSSAQINRKFGSQDINGVNDIAGSIPKPDVRESKMQGNE